MGKSKTREQRKTLLKYLDNLGYKWNENILFNRLEQILPRYMAAKSEKDISDFVLLPGRVDTVPVYQIYVKKE